MKTTFWLTVSAMLSLGSIAQELTNVPPAGDLQNTPASVTSQSPAVFVSDLPATGAAPASVTAPAKPQKKSATRRMAIPPDLRTVPLRPGVATVIASNVNVRGQAGLKGEVVTRLTKGDQVTVLEEIQLSRSASDEPSAWAKILLPPAAKVFVFADYVNQAGGVSARRLNLRAGPGENYSVLGRLEKGDAVKVVATRGSWLEIEPPAKTYAFMAAQYLRQEGETPATVADATAPAETKTNKEAVLPPVTTSTVADSSTVTTASSEIPGGASTGTTNITASPGETAGAVSETKTPEEEEEEPLPPRIVQREGVVRGTLSIQAPTRFELWDPVSRRTINYLHTEAGLVDLSRYKGLRIIVTGEESLDERWRNTPIIDIQKIVVLE